MNVHTIRRRAHTDKPGDEEVTFVTGPGEFDVEPLKLHGVPVSEWTRPSRIPRKREPVNFGGVLLAIVIGIVLAAAMVHWASWPNT